MRVRGATIRQRMSLVGSVLVLVVGIVGSYQGLGKVAAATTESIWPTAAVPTNKTVSDAGAVELGVKFKATVSGSATGVRFYKGTGNTGTHVGHLWALGNTTALATVTFSGETTSGWQTATFPTAPQLTVGSTYVVSYLAPKGHYAYDGTNDPQSVKNTFTSATGHLTTLAGSSNGNGVYMYTSAVNGAYPSNTTGGSNYWVDVLFTPGGTTPPDTTAPSVSLTAPTSGATLSGTTNLTATATDNVGVSRVEFYVDNALTGTATTATVNSYSVSLDTTTLTNATHSFTAKAYDAAGNVAASATVTATVNNTVTTPPPAAANIYTSTYTPDETSANDPGAVTLGVQFQSQTAGYISGIRFYKGTGNTGTHVGSLWTAKHTLVAQATFTSETASGWQDVRFSDMVPIDANTTYIASYFAPNGHYAYTGGGLASGRTNAPLVALPGSSTPGGNGVYAYGPAGQVPLNSTGGSDYAVDVDFTTTYVAPTAAQPTPRVGTRGTGAVLVLTDPTNQFSDNYCSALLSTKGVSCAATDTGNLTAASVLSPYKTVILADGAALTSAQITLVTNWMNAGGNFIAMRPASNLNSLLGLGNRTGILPDAYLKVDASQSPGAGIDSQTLQYHGVADRHSLLAGTRAVATLYSDASTATTYPAVTTRASGSGTASAWMFDLARSVVYTREGNPGLAGLAPASTDGNPRVVDRFALGYLDISKAAVPQADLQVSLLTNQIETAAAPSPIKWAFPSYKPNTNHPNGLLKAALVLTGDDHNADSKTLSRFASETAASPAGCSVADWTCIRSTSYAYSGSFSDAAAKPYTDAGFEVSLHVASGTSCAANWQTQAALDSIFGSALSAWQAGYPTISAAHPPLTERFHCYGVWNDYATVAKVEAAHGITGDTNTSCWPNSFLNVAQCLYNGSGLPQNIADSDGSLTGVYQFATQATDENPSTVTQAAINGLVTNATGANGYYGYFTILAHLDNLAISNQTETAVLAVAAANDVPVISAAQAQTFWSAREATAISNPSYAASTVTFSVTNPANNLLLLQPANYNGKTISTITAGSTNVSFGTQTINGVSYAVFPAAAAGSYVVTYN